MSSSVGMTSPNWMGKYKSCSSHHQLVYIYIYVYIYMYMHIYICIYIYIYIHIICIHLSSHYSHYIAIVFPWYSPIRLSSTGRMDGLSKHIFPRKDQQSSSSSFMAWARARKMCRDSRTFWRKKHHFFKNLLLVGKLDEYSSQLLPIEEGINKTGWWVTYPSEEYESQVGWLFPIYGKIQVMFQSPPTRKGNFWIPLRCSFDPSLCSPRRKAFLCWFTRGVPIWNHPGPRLEGPKGFTPKPKDPTRVATWRTLW